MHERYKTIAAAMTCFIAAVLLYAPTCGFGLLEWDDQYHLTNNPFLQVDSPNRFGHFWREPYGNLYVPITYNVWALVYGLVPAHSLPAALHALNVAVHAVNVVLVFFVLRTLTGRSSVFAALVGAALFAVHPLQVESVAWISELRGLLAAMFALLATWIYVWVPAAIQRDAHGHLGRLPREARDGFVRSITVSACLALGLLCKPSVAMMPALWFVLDRFFLGRPWKTTLLSLALPMVLVVASLLSMRAMQGGGSIDAGTWWQRPFLAGDTLALQLRHVVWPLGLTADYSRTPRVALTDGAYFTAFIPVVALALCMKWRTRSIDGHWALAGLLLFTAALLPVLGLLPFDFQRISTTADRYTYLALLGPALIVAHFVRNNRIALAAACVFLALLAWRNLDQQTSWRSDKALWTHAVDVNPRALVATANLASQAERRGDAGEARRLYERVIQIAPYRGNGYRGLAKLSLDAGDTLAALKFYQQAIEKEPTDAFAWEGAASVLVALQRPTDAEPAYRKALEIDPRFSDAWNNLGAHLIQQGQLTEASQALERAVEIHPRHPRAWANLAIVRDANGDATGARSALEKSEALCGIDVGVRQLLTGRAMRRQDWPAAEHWLRLSLRDAPEDVAALNDLGQVLAVSGRIDEAIVTFKRALELRPDLTTLRENLESAERLKALDR